MKFTFQTAKTAALAILIGAGAMMQGTAAEARTIEKMVVAGGCFWCVESDFERVTGVTDVVSGYTGGSTTNPTYKTVKGTGHYEAVEITYDADVVSYTALLNLFLRSIDPTDAGGQFCDRGESYRTAIFVSNPAEEAAARTELATAQAALGRQIVTPILPAARFYLAEAYHQNYYRGTESVITRRGVKTKAEAYKFYRDACGRDARVKQLWGSAAPFVSH